MLSERAERLARFCRHRGRANLRVVVGYDDGEYVVAHVRDDVRDRYDATGVERLVDAFRDVHGALWTPSFGDSPLDTPTATVHYHRGTVVVQLFVDAECGFLASFDEAASPTLAAFVDECRMRVAGERAD